MFYLARLELEEVHLDLDLLNLHHGSHVLRQLESPHFISLSRLLCTCLTPSLAAHHLHHSLVAWLCVISSTLGRSGVRLDIYSKRVSVAHCIKTSVQLGLATLTPRLPLDSNSFMCQISGANNEPQLVGKCSIVGQWIDNLLRLEQAFENVGCF